MMTDTALIRSVPNSFHRALRREERASPDVDLARDQHDRYRQHLMEAGYLIEQVPADQDHPDCVFVEDTAVIVGSVALITRPGAPSRRGETWPVAQALSARLPIIEMTEPATLDGGDVMRMGGTIYVGHSQRTNREGIDCLRVIAEGEGLALVAVEVHGALHLKSVVHPVDDETVVITPGAVDEELLNRLRVLYEADAEQSRFSTLPMRDGRVLTTTNAPATARLVADGGRDVVPIDISQIQAADGGLTCMSILF